MAFFDFTGFAQAIYSDNPTIYPVSMPLRAQVNAGTVDQDQMRIALEERFLLPALYGGESGKTFEALVVLQAPSVPFTTREWKTWTAPCATPAEAIQRHRTIFFKWAFAGERPAKLFDGILKTRPATAEEFFQRLYITDIWKDAAWTEGAEQVYVQYWHSKLKDELRSVATSDVILVGGAAQENARECLPHDRRPHPFPFPTWSNNRFDAQLQEALEKFHKARARDVEIAEMEREIEKLEEEVRHRQRRPEGQA